MKIVTEITRDGQKYVDRPVYEIVSKPNPVDVAVAAAAGNEVPKIIFDVKHYERTKLQWVKPDGKGRVEPV